MFHDAGDEFRPTQMREYHDALQTLQGHEQVALAELHAEDPEPLMARFDHSVRTVAAYPEITEAFHGARSEVWTEKKGWPITSTTTFAADLVDGHHEVTDFPELDFDLVDREIFPLRSTTDGIDARGAGRSIDLLLRAANGLPVVGDLAVAGDCYLALVRALACAVELSSDSQLERLADHYDFIVPGDQAVISIYLIAPVLPEPGTDRRRSFEASRTIVDELMIDPRVAPVIRHIVCLEASFDAHGRPLLRCLF
jgi:hypothetical protein